MKALEAFDLYRFYHAGEEETLALRGVNLSLEEGETLAVMGPSGSGKSTLLSCISGIDEPDGGHVVLFGQRFTRKPEAVRAAMRTKDIGIVMQTRSLLDHLTVDGNILLKMRLANAMNRRRVGELTELVGLGERSRSYPSQLSGGEAARAAIAVALAASPRILIADEPTGEVDALTEERILELFDSHKKNGGSAIIATHSESLASRADRVLHLFDGRVEGDV
jgi:putative ABC transport system ATP-binding protein